MDKVIKNVGRTGLPWGILGDFNYGAKDMHNSLTDGQVKNAKVMTVGNTCFTKDSKSAIDYGIVDRALAPWMWHGRTVQTGLATHRPVEWCLKWQWSELIEVVTPCPKASLDRVPGPGRRAGPQHQAALDGVTTRAEALYGKWGTTRLAPDDTAGRAALQKELNEFHERWQGLASAEVHFMTGCGL